MEKEKFNTLMGLFTGLSLVVVSTFMYWSAETVAAFTISIVIAMSGIFLTLSRIMILVEIGSHRRWWFWVTIAFFASLALSFLPLCCVERVVIGKEFTYCFYLNLWEFLLT